jgi:hypothetical protein
MEDIETLLLLDKEIGKTDCENFQQTLPGSLEQNRPCPAG